MAHQLRLLKGAKYLQAGRESRELQGTEAGGTEGFIWDTQTGMLYKVPKGGCRFRPSLSLGWEPA